MPEDRRPKATAAERGLTQDGKPDPKTTPEGKPLPRPNRRFRFTGDKKTAQILAREKPKHRTQTLFPYLIIRSHPGDRGARPIAMPAMPWECCDIHLMPDGTGDFDYSKTVLKAVPGRTYRVFVHVWNLGQFAAYGARLRVWSVEPGFYNGNGASSSLYHPKFIGGAYFNLDDRDGANAHRLIELTSTWTVGPENDGHDCLIAGVEHATDTWDGVQQASTHRHVGQRHLSLASGSDDTQPLLTALGGRMAGSDLEMLITHVDVAQAGLAGAAARGMASAANASSWDHTGSLVMGTDVKLVAGIRRDASGLRYVDLHRIGPIPLPGSSQWMGVAVQDLSNDLPSYLRQALGIRDLSASSLLKGLGSPTAARVLRFVTSEQLNTMPPGKSGGYSLLLASS